MFATSKINLRSIGYMFSGLILAAILSFQAFAAPAPQPINVLTFNILAPCWADPSYYPTISWPYLDKEYRRGKIINFLQSHPEADIIALQEVTQTEFSYINNALKNKYMGFQSFHAPTYWSNWITVNPPWEPNGNAIFMKRTRFINMTFNDVALSDSGNHGAFANANEKTTNQKIRAISIHLDSDHSYNREREFKAVLMLMPPQNNIVDVIAGDFNIDINNANLQSDINQANFTNILASLGITDVTSPYSTSYYAHSVFGVIDAILVRNGVPLSGSVIDFNLFTLYPETKDEDPRVRDNMKISGSDHFPVQGAFQLLNAQ